MIFTLSIHMGNDAMQTPADLAEALRELAGKLSGYGNITPGSGSIRDINGNNVGVWDIAE